MCGIYAEEMTGGGLPPEVDYSSERLEAMAHRGPDEAGVVIRGGFALGFRRLKIVDTEEPAAHQPYVTPQGNVIAVNGEIYNYRSLHFGCRSEIEMLGGMIDEGLDPRQFCDGDYGIVHWNPSQQVLTLYRDRFGVIPLYFQTHPFLAVSSERRRLERPIEVPAFGRVVISHKARYTEHVVQNRFMHYGITCEGLDSNIEDAGITRRLFLDAVLSRAAHADHGFSCTLSGGLDSSAVVLACKALGLQPKALLCVVPKDFESHDLIHARMVADACGWPLTEIRVGMEDMVEAAPSITEHLDLYRYGESKEWKELARNLPLLKWRASVRNWFAALHSPTRVILCGEGADEVIEGYPPHTTNHPGVPYRVAQHQLTSIRSLPHINLDRTNKLGLAHSKEYRAPFLASTLSYWLMSLNKRAGKQVMRAVLSTLDAPPRLLNREKWGNDETFFDHSLDKILQA